jgi:hypothetical protein
MVANPMSLEQLSRDVGAYTITPYCISGSQKRDVHEHCVSMAH